MSNRGVPDVVMEILHLNKAPIDELRKRYEKAFCEPPAARGRKAILARLANEYQRRARDAGNGDRIRKRARSRPAPPAVAKRKRRPGEPRVGVVLTREWRGTEIRATVRENGIEIDGRLFRSLSEAAREITGSRWNGRLFFGLVGRTRKGGRR